MVLGRSVRLGVGRFLPPAVVPLSLLFAAVANAATAADLDAEAFFEKHVRPLLISRCGECHVGEKAGGGLSLETQEAWASGGDSGPAIVPGDPDASLLIQAVRGDDPDWRMPPEEAGPPLSANEVEVLTQWVAEGAFDPRTATASIGGMSEAEARSWWAFAPLEGIDARGGPERIDAMLDAQIAASGLAAVEPADDRSIIRRATYDLTGLPPSPEDVEAFLEDASPDKVSQLIERLLASPDYGVRYGRHWLDVVRYADTAGENTDRPLPHAWRYRNWVFDAFNADMPYEEFVQLQLAGDLMRATESRERLNEGIVATGYLAIARRFGHDIEKDRHLTYEDVIDNLGKTFLGLTTGCARCHDHKYDPVSSEDYYALCGILESTRFAFPGCEPKGQPRDLVPLVSSEEMAAGRAPWEQRKAAYEAAVQRREQSVARSSLKAAAGDVAEELSSGEVVEGGKVSLAGASDQPIERTIGKGEVLQLTVFPNRNHGADTTRVAWTIEEASGALDEPRLQATLWSAADLIDGFEQGPYRQQAGASWCLLEEQTDGPAFLSRFEAAAGGVPPLQAWSDGDTPSVCINPSNDSVPAWTTLPPRSFFVHPGPDHPVIVAWICPRDGRYRIRGSVEDAHPADGLDGVSFRLTHHASSSYGEALSAAGQIVVEPLPSEPGPEPTFPVAYAVVDAKPADVRLQQRGDPEQLGEEVPRRWLKVFGGEAVSADSGSGRAELAKWILSEPLAARVVVNRLWQWHFGRGLVATPNDFGSRGEPPSHPELLDWLAARFLAEGGRFKPMHRLIMQTAAYRRSGLVGPALLEADPGNRLVARFTRRRLSAEELRDSLLAASGWLDRSVGEAHPFPPESAWTYTQHSPFEAVYPTRRRSAYVMRARQRQHPFFALFDGADPNASTPRRETTTVPTQALYFLNDPFFHEQAFALAERLLAEVPHAGEGSSLTDDRIQHAYSLAFQRRAMPEEITLLSDLVADAPAEDAAAWAGLARVVLASSEFLHVD
jgi:hypothetical protein